MSVSAVVVSHGHARELAESLPALVPQVDETLVVANVPESVPTELHGARVHENERPLGYAANINLAVARTFGDYVFVCNPDAVPSPGCVETLSAFMDALPRCGVAGPQLRNPDGTWQASRRRFPTVAGTLVRRTPLRVVLRPERRQRGHYLLDDRPEDPAPADWMLGGCLLLRRRMLEEIGGYDEGFRMYGEEIDLCYRAAQAGWERWYVPAAIARHRWDALTDRRFLTRRTIWHWRSILRFVRKHPERLLAWR